MYRETALRAKSLKNPSKIHVNPCKIVITWKCFEPKQNLVSARSTILQAAYLWKFPLYSPFVNIDLIVYWLCRSFGRLTAHGSRRLSSHSWCLAVRWLCLLPETKPFSRSTKLSYKQLQEEWNFSASSTRNPSLASSQTKSRGFQTHPISVRIQNKLIDWLKPRRVYKGVTEKMVLGAGSL